MAEQQGSPAASDEEKYGPIPEDEFCVYGTVYSKPEHADELEALYRKMVDMAKTEPGVIHYAISRNTADPSKFHFFERYASKRHFEAHTSRPETRKILSSGWVRDFEGRFEKPL